MKFQLQPKRLVTSLYKSDESNLASGGRSQTTPRRANRRQILYSVVPESTLLTPIRRSSGYGKAGRLDSNLYQSF